MENKTFPENNAALKHNTILSVRELTKNYGPVTVLDHVSAEFREGEILALMGENGAGKSTLCKIISGAIEPSGGDITIDGVTVNSFTPIKAKAAGIGMVYQEFNLVPELTIYENLFVGKEIRKGMFVDTKAMIRKSEEIFSEIGIQIDCSAKIKNLSVAYCQLVEIAKALLENSKVLILDEPTAPLMNNEVEILFRVLQRLKQSGISIVYISHRLEEVFRLCDRVIVLRDGQLVKTMDVADTNAEELISLMIGRTLSQEFPPREPDFDYSNAQTVLKVEHIENEKIRDISFELKKGEILGIAGLVGAGRTETVRAIFGADPLLGGDIYVNGKKVKIQSPADAIANSIGLIPEDRKRQGVMAILPISINMSIIVIRKLCKGLFIQQRKEKTLLSDKVKELAVKADSLSKPVSTLSGGNQQKIVLAKWLSTNCDILIFDEPTRGIDVGAKKEIYDFIFALKRAGKSMIVISSEMSEILNLSDRILVLHEGRISGEVYYQKATQNGILSLASGLA